MLPTLRYLLLACLVALLSPLAIAGEDQSAANKRETQRSGMNESLRRVENETGGTVLSAERQQRGGREVYRVKVLDQQGRVRVVQDDPANAPRRSAPARESGRRDEAYRRARGDE